MNETPSLQTDETESDSVNEIVQKLVAEDEREPVWSWMGFELFDLVVIVCQAMFFFFAWPLDQVFLHPAVSCLGAMGFLVCLYYLGQTKQYTIGYSKISGVHEYLHYSILLGGFFAGMMLCVLVLAPLSLPNGERISADIVVLPGIALGLFSACLIPYMAHRAENPTEATKFLDCPPWLFWMGRAFILILSNTMLLHICNTTSAMAGDLFDRFLLIGFLMCGTYIPIRVQEMFLRPTGPHFQSLIQTQLILVFFGTVSL